MLKITAILFIVFLFSCQRNKEETCSNDIAIPAQEVKIDYASNFELTPTNNGFNLSIISPETGEVEKKIAIVPEDHHRIISLSSTLNGMLAILEEQEQLIGISSINYIYDSIIQQQYNDKKTIDFGDETSVSLEKIINSKADIIFYSGFGDKFPHQEKLERLGITIIPIYDWRENHPLGKAEWIKLIGVLTNNQEEASRYFNKITLEYEALITKAENASFQPTVLAGSMFGDVWYAPGGESYFATLFNDAGADYVYSESKGTASLELSMEQILKDNEFTQLWINPSQPTKTKVLTIAPKIKFLKAFEDHTYCYTSRQNKFWEQSAAMPHLLLKDLVQILHPEMKLEKELYFYAKVN